MSSTESDEAEFAAVLAEMQAEQPSADTDEVAEENVDEGQDPELDDNQEDSGDEPEGEPLEGTDAETLRTEVADLLDKGDLKKACEKLGVDPAIFKINNRQFAAIRKGETEAKRLHIEADTKLTKAEQVQKRAEEIYGPIVAGSKSARNGDWSTAKSAIEVMFEMPFEKVVESIQKGVKPLDPAQAEVMKLRKELEEERANKAKEETKTAETNQHIKDVQLVTGKLAGTPLEGIEGAAEEIVKTIRASYNPALKKNTLTLREAYKQVKTAYEKKAAQLARLAGVAPTASAPATAPKAGNKPSRTPLTARQTSAPKVSEVDEFAASVAEAAKAAAAADRRSRRSK